MYNAGRGRLEIQDGESYLPVSIQDRTCACGKWQINGIPCKHAVRALRSVNKIPANYVSDWYSVRKYKEAYGLIIYPIGDAETWPESNLPQIQPPMLKRAVGRPPRNRRREEEEAQKGKRYAPATWKR